MTQYWMPLGSTLHPLGQHFVSPGSTPDLPPDPLLDLPADLPLHPPLDVLHNGSFCFPFAMQKCQQCHLDLVQSSSQVCVHFARRTHAETGQGG